MFTRSEQEADLLQKFCEMGKSYNFVCPKLSPDIVIADFQPTAQND